MYTFVHLSEENVRRTFATFVKVPVKKQYCPRFFRPREQYVRRRQARAFPPSPPPTWMFITNDNAARDANANKLFKTEPSFYFFDKDDRERFGDRIDSDSKRVRFDFGTSEIWLRSGFYSFSGITFASKFVWMFFNTSLISHNESLFQTLLVILSQRMNFDSVKSASQTSQRISLLNLISDWIKTWDSSDSESNESMNESFERIILIKRSEWLGPVKRIVFSIPSWSFDRGIDEIRRDVIVKFR